MRKLGRNHGSLQSIEAKVPANQFVVVLGFCTVTAEATHSLRFLRIIGNHHSSVAHPTEILGRKERKASVVSNATRSPAFVFSPYGLCRIFDHNQAMFLG